MKYDGCLHPRLIYGVEFYFSPVNATELDADSFDMSIFLKAGFKGEVERLEEN